MKQVFQSLSSGDVFLLDTPVPKAGKGKILIKTSLSLVSAGTERFLIDFGKSNIFQKALKQPDRLKEVFDKTKTDGIANTFKSVQSKLDEPLPLGYCNVGKIIALGEGVSNFKVGQRVVSNGYHAEIVSVSKNLCAAIPDNVSDSQAVFTVLGAVGLQGIRLIKPTLGETILVSGLGLVGIITAQLLKINGCRVLGIDLDKKKCELARKYGINSFQITEGVDPIKWCLNNTNQVGVDGVVITASTKSSDPIDIAANVSRTRGRIVLVGVTGLEIKRDLFYKKELTFQVSCSYGPGRYDSNYEELGQDYPIGYVRWTEKRNFEAVLNALSSGNFKTEELISRKFKIDDSAEAYKLLLEDYSTLGIILSYPEKQKKYKESINFEIKSSGNIKKSIYKQCKLSFIGAGNYARNILIPAFSKAGAELNIISSRSGIGPAILGKKFGFSRATTNEEEIFKDKKSNVIVISTRHNSHAELVLKALKNGKNVFVEKPLCLTMSELNKISDYLNNKDNNDIPLLMIGFNRRFSPLVTNLKESLDKITSPKAYIYTCNAGYLDENHWTQDPSIGGGRLLGEACHFVDLLRFLDGSEIQSMNLTNALDEKPIPDTFSLQLKFQSGSIATVHYFSNGNKLFAKERIEIFSDQKIFLLNNFKVLKAWGVKGFKTKRLFAQNKGQLNCVRSFLNAIKNNSSPPIPYNQIFEVQRLLLETEKK